MIPLFLMTTSCASLTETNPKLQEIKIPPELLEECVDPPKLVSGTKGEVILYIHDVKYAYLVCRDRHSALIHTVKEITSNEN